MIFKIAWRNVWRNKLRSLVVMNSILLGVWSGIFVIGLSLGMNNQRTENFISTTIAHIQIHNPNYLIDKELKYSIENHQQITDWLIKNNVQFTDRIKLSGMAASANGANGVSIDGIDPNLEKGVSNISESLVEGDYFESNKKNQIVIGSKLANKLKLKVGSKTVLTFQTMDGEISSAAFRVVGIFKTPNSRFDEIQVFTKKADLNNLLFAEGKIHEIAMVLDKNTNVDEFTNLLSQNFPDSKVRNWKEIAPDLAYADEMMKQFLYIIMIIILLALSFGIINTMMMAILERKHELGMLMAIGMNKTKLFFMIVFETLYLSIISGPLGLLIGFSTIEYFKKYGIDMSSMGKGLEEFGYSTIVYTDMVDGFYFITLIMVMLTALISSLFPALRALKLKPVEAIRGL